MTTSSGSSLTRGPRIAPPMDIVRTALAAPAPHRLPPPPVPAAVYEYLARRLFPTSDYLPRPAAGNAAAASPSGRVAQPGSGWPCFVKLRSQSELIPATIVPELVPASVASPFSAEPDAPCPAAATPSVAGVPTAWPVSASALSAGASLTMISRTLFEASAVSALTASPASASSASPSPSSSAPAASSAAALRAGCPQDQVPSWAQPSPSGGLLVLCLRVHFDSPQEFPFIAPGQSIAVYRRLPEPESAGQLADAAAGIDEVKDAAIAAVIRDAADETAGGQPRASMTPGAASGASPSTTKAQTQAKGHAFDPSRPYASAGALARSGDGYVPPKSHMQPGLWECLGSGTAMV